MIVKDFTSKIKDVRIAVTHRSLNIHDLKLKTCYTINYPVLFLLSSNSKYLGRGLCSSADDMNPQLPSTSQRAAYEQNSSLIFLTGERPRRASAALICVGGRTFCIQDHQKRKLQHPPET
jgi:hypothetical protein